MKKTLIIGIVMLVIGVGISVIFESYFGKIVLALCEWSTNDKLQFVDKNICFFTTSLYNLSFGISFAAFGLKAQTNSVTKNAVDIAIGVVLFCVSLVVICTLNANIKLAQCTLCDDGILELSYYDSNYGQILGVCALLAGIPSFLKLTHMKKASVQS